jgi:hypothetical protein
MNMNRIFCLVNYVLILSSVITSTAYTWNANGHCICAYLAYTQIDKDQFIRIVDTIKEHERFEEDFLAYMPEKIKEASEDEKDLWIFLHASTWPDFGWGYHGEDKAKFFHGTWHYINEPVFLTQDHAIFFNGIVPANLSRVWRKGKPQDTMNIFQALHECDYQLSNPRNDNPTKAIYICWVLHLVGDIHQPMHSSAAFTPNKLQKGDQGGNFIKVDTESGKLHSTWDALLGSTKEGTYESQGVAYVTQMGNRLLRDPGMVNLGKKAIKNMNYNQWIQESYDIARTSAYNSHVTEKILEFDRSSDETMTPIKLSDEYMIMAKDIANERMIQSGFRLAEKLKNINYN